MMPIELEVDCTKAARSIANFSIGLAELCVQGNVEDALPAGSGTLVTIGAVAGILTAAHVVANLPDRGEIALIRFPGRPGELQKQTIDMTLAEKLIIASGSNSRLGPDLGFLRLPKVNVDNLRATNSFLNIGKRYGAELPAHEGSAYVDALVGVVAEWTQDDLITLRPRRKSFELLYSGGTVTRKYACNGFDLCNFRPSNAPESKLPASYGGVSGGGLWRTYFMPDGSGNVIENRLVGLAFYEVPKANGLMELICHGPRSVYKYAIAKINQKWPTEVA